MLWPYQIHPFKNIGALAASFLQIEPRVVYCTMGLHQVNGLKLGQVLQRLFIIKNNKTLFFSKSGRKKNLLYLSNFTLHYGNIRYVKRHLAAANDKLLKKKKYIFDSIK